MLRNMVTKLFFGIEYCIYYYHMAYNTNYKIDI